MHIVTGTAVYYERLFQPLQVVVHGFHRQGAPLALQKLHYCVSRKGLSDVFNYESGNTVEQLLIGYVMSPSNIIRYNGSVYSFHYLIGGMVVEIPECYYRKSAFSDVFVQEFIFREFAVLMELHILSERQRINRD